MKFRILKDQKGIALFVAMILLLVLTLIGISSVTSSLFETKISGNNRFGEAAFYASEGGVEVGINQLPNLAAYSGNMGDEIYRSGKMVPSIQQPLINLGLMSMEGYEATWEFRRFQINSTGQSFDAIKEVETQISLGPFGAGTQYNN
jgi:Tfp pilus assembly protein PilX